MHLIRELAETPQAGLAEAISLGECRAFHKRSAYEREEAPDDTVASAPGAECCLAGNENSAPPASTIDATPVRDRAPMAEQRSVEKSELPAFQREDLNEGSRGAFPWDKGHLEPRSSVEPHEPREPGWRCQWTVREDRRAVNAVCGLDDETGAARLRVNPISLRPDCVGSAVAIDVSHERRPTDAHAPVEGIAGSRWSGHGH